MKFRNLLTKNVVDIDFKPITITKELRNSSIGVPCFGSVRLNMGKFYTTEEWEEKRKKILNTPLK